MTTTPRCQLCSARHTNPVPPNEWGSEEHRAQSATDEAIALAIANPEVFINAWDDAVRVLSSLNRMEEDLRVIYKQADPATRALLRPIRDRQRRASCAAIRALWHLPHPSQIHQARTGCLLV
jgi:hypothetical protein